MADESKLGTNEQDVFARMRELNPEVVDAARKVAVRAVAMLPRDLAPEEEPAHINLAAPSEELS